MKQLTTAASALVVALLLMMSFNASAVEGSQKRRAKAPRINYSQFSHRTHVNAEKPACESCHKFPTDNWKNVRAEDVAFPDVAEFPEHASCLNCHRQQFFARQRPAPAICTNCHVNVTPRDTARFLFPSLGDVTNAGARKKTNVTEFAINFPHDKHEDQECVACHQMDKEGDIKTKPNSHTVCFTCHNVESEVAPLPSTCNACHKLGEPDEKSDPVATAPGTDRFQGRRQYRHAGGSAALGRSQYHHAVAGGSNGVFADQGMKVPDNADYSKFQHDSAYHQRLPCLLCHRRESTSPQPIMPGAKDHLPCAGCHVKQFADRSNAICTNCHTEPSTGKLKSFPALTSFIMKFDHARHTGVACSNCHRPARSGVALTIPAGFNAHVTCFQCHGPQAKTGDRDISSCGVCHQLGPYTRTSQTARAFRVGFSHAAHNRDERLNCNDCHRIRGGQADDVAAPQPLNHHAARGSFSCMSCHNGKRAFGGDDFSSCKRCHQGSAWHF